jgi:phage shock protein A
MSSYQEDLIEELRTDFAILENEIAAITAERDRLAAENAELRKDTKVGDFILSLTMERDLANATLDRMREAIRRQHAELFYVTAAQELRVGFDAKQPETPNDDR